MLCCRLDGFLPSFRPLSDSAPMARIKKTVRLTELAEKKLKENCDRLNGMSESQFINGLVMNYGDQLWLKSEGIVQMGVLQR